MTPLRTHVWTATPPAPNPSIRPIEVATAIALIMLAMFLRWAPSRTRGSGALQGAAISSAEWASSARRPTLRQLLGALSAGCAIGLFIGGSGGLFCGLLAAVAVLIFGSRRAAEREARSRLRLVAAAPPVVDLFAAGLAAGLLPADAAAAAATAFTPQNDNTPAHPNPKPITTEHANLHTYRPEPIDADHPAGRLERIAAGPPALDASPFERIDAEQFALRADRLEGINAEHLASRPSPFERFDAEGPARHAGRFERFRPRRLNSPSTPAIEPAREIAQRFADAAQALRRGVDPEAAWRPLAVDDVTAPVAAAALRASRTGAPASETVAKAARDLWSAADHAAQARLRSATARAAMPLALCFLPAFVLLGIVPTMLGILAELRP